VGHGQFCQEGDSHAETSLPLPILPQMDTKNSRKKISLSPPHTKLMESVSSCKEYKEALGFTHLILFGLHFMEALIVDVEVHTLPLGTLHQELPIQPLLPPFGEDIIDSDAIEEDNTPKDAVEAVAMHRKGEGERGHLMLEALPIFAQEDPHMIGLLGRQKYIDIVTTAAVGWIEGVCFLFLLFLLLFLHPLLASGAARFKPENCRIDKFSCIHSLQGLYCVVEECCLLVLRALINACDPVTCFTFVANFM